jgi:C4-type Zn-finger protein
MITREEAKEYINRLATNPDTEMANVAGFLDQLCEVYDTIDSLTQSDTDNKAKIRELQDTNIKLFIGQTQRTQVDDVPQEKSIEDLAKELVGRN